MDLDGFWMGFDGFLDGCLDGFWYILNGCSWILDGLNVDQTDAKNYFWIAFDGFWMDFDRY